MSLLTDAIANTALSKLKNHMKEEGIACYMASIDAKGEFTTIPIKGEFVVVPMEEYIQMKEIVKKQILNNGK